MKMNHNNNDKKKSCAATPSCGVASDAQFKSIEMHE
jgi:hypothetical protein